MFVWARLQRTIACLRLSPFAFKPIRHDLEQIIHIVETAPYLLYLMGSCLALAEYLSMHVEHDCCGF